MSEIMPEIIIGADDGSEIVLNPQNTIVRRFDESEYDHCVYRGGEEEMLIGIHLGTKLLRYMEQNAFPTFELGDPDDFAEDMLAKSATEKLIKTLSE